MKPDLAAQPPPLHYAALPPWYRRKWFYRIITGLAVLPLVCASVLWAPAAVRHFRLIYWQSRCMQYTPAPGQVVNVYSNSGDNDVPIAWSRLYSMLSPPGLRSRGTLYLGWLKRPDGARRLVAIDTVTWSVSGQTHHIGLLCRVIVPAGPMRPARLRPGLNQPRFVIIDLGPDSQVRFGVRDPQDPTHLTIEYWHDGRHYFIDGWLRNDDSVLLELRSEQAPVWPAPSSRPSA